MLPERGGMAGRRVARGFFLAGLARAVAVARARAVALAARVACCRAWIVACTSGVTVGVGVGVGVLVGVEVGVKVDVGSNVGVGDGIGVGTGVVVGSSTASVGIEVGVKVGTRVATATDADVGVSSFRRPTAARAPVIGFTGVRCSISAMPPTKMTKRRKKMIRPGALDDFGSCAFPEEGIDMGELLRSEMERRLLFYAT